MNFENRVFYKRNVIGIFLFSGNKIICYVLVMIILLIK